MMVNVTRWYEVTSVDSMADNCWNGIRDGVGDNTYRPYEMMVNVTRWYEVTSVDSMADNCWNGIRDGIGDNTYPETV